MKRFVSVLHGTFENYRNDFLRTRIRCHGRLPEIVAWLRIGMTMLLLYLEEREQLSQERSEELHAGRAEDQGCPERRRTESGCCH